MKRYNRYKEALQKACVFITKKHEGMQLKEYDIFLLLLLKLKDNNRTPLTMSLSKKTIFTVETYS